MKPGTVVGERFEIERLAGQGGMGAVYRARDRSCGEAVAVKVLHQRDAPADDRFVREVRAIEGLRHPAIVSYVSHGVSDAGERYLVTEWLEGEDLGQRLDRGPLGIGEAVTLVARVAEAVGVAHARGIVHRDIKPGNLFLIGGESAEVRLLDFGVARLRGTSLVATATGTVLGTPGYMAPEQARGEKEVGARADVFALGAVLFQCLTGRFAFTGENVMAVLAKVLLEDPPALRELRPEASVALEDLVTRMLAKEPEGRPADGAAVAAELGALEETTAVAAAPRSQTLTGGEQRILCVVLAAGVTGDDAAVLDLVRAAVEVFGAVAERLVDGSVVVTLGGPGSATDQVTQAARCALALRALLPDRPLALATGHAVTGDRVPAGQAIDRAARLLMTADTLAVDVVPAGGRAAIAMDAASAGLLDARFEVRADARGFGLLGERELSESARQLLGRPSPTVGRDREIATLSALFDECVEDQVARAALVTAPAGAGKSRIRFEFLNGVRRREKPVIIWLGRGDPMSAGSPFGMIAPAIRRAASILDGEPLSVRQAKLRGRLARHLSGPELTRVTAFLGELIAVPFPDEQNIELRAARQDARLMGDQMMRAWQDWLAAEAASQPVVIVLEDLHWGDPPTVSFTDAALRHLKDRPLMVLALARPEVHELFPNLWAERGAQEIRLGELTRRASEKLVRDVLGDAVTAETVERVVAQAAGNAFYLEELIRAVAEGRADALPDTVLAMVQARLQSLEPVARRILRAASVFGASFWRGSVAALLGGSEGAAALDHWLDELAEREFITPRTTSRFQGETEYQFRHDLVRAAAYDMLTEGDRVLGHRLAAEWLEGMGESDAMALAGHYEAGGAPDRAIPWYLHAAGQSLEGNDLASAVERAERGVACGAQAGVRGALHLVQAEAECWLGKYAQAKLHGLEAMDLLAHASPAWASATNFAQWGMVALEHFDELEVLVATLREVDMERTTPELLITLSHVIMGKLNRGAYRRALDLLVHTEARARFLGEPDSRAETSLEMARVFAATYDGTLSDRLDKYEEGIQGLVRIGDLRQAVLQRNNLGFAKIQTGGFEEAEADLRLNLEVAGRLGLRLMASSCKQNLGLALFYQGRFEEARGLVAQAVSEHAAMKERYEHGARAYGARCTMGLGRALDAEREARAAIAALWAGEPVRLLLLSVLANSLLLQGKAAEALAATTEAMALYDSGTRIEDNENIFLLAHAEALAANGLQDEARPAIRSARDRLLARAAKIRHSEWRVNFLERMPENARTLALAREWLGED